MSGRLLRVLRLQFHAGRVHVPPNRDWTLYLEIRGFQLEVNMALPPKKEKKK